ncbi:hypothetical protein AURDEDRAFT_187904 [Auricularia subglabra TFB-10046 SS5]|uniref:Uncharacterized protein n=1 Tax=Auricularia subglabra (strain TFB-10046 / SS5) TaxID=717982 RepID=J0LHZ3_AURST|nr:hypothetical protein AURDEDRAFT_187904 [Auricularia subglabra TFB-10046 SS5]
MTHKFSLQYEDFGFVDEPQSRRWLGVDYLVYSIPDEGDDSGSQPRDLDHTFGRRWHYLSLTYDRWRAHLNQQCHATAEIDHSNSRIQYSPPGILPEEDCKGRPENEACSGLWWTETGNHPGIHDTFGPNTNLSFEFRGSALYFFGVTLDAGASALASIDDDPAELVEFSSPYKGPHYQQLLYFTTSLDPTHKHTFHLRFRGHGSTVNSRKWLGVNHVIYTVNDDSTDHGDNVDTVTVSSSAGSATDGITAPTTNYPDPGGGSGDQTQSGTLEPTSRSSTAGANTDSTSSSKSLSSAMLAGIAAGVTCGVVFLLLVPLVVWLLRRQFVAQPVQSIALKRASAGSDPYQYAFAVPGRASAEYVHTPQPPNRRPSPFDPPDQRRYSAAFVSTASSPGAPVDERLHFFVPHEPEPDPPPRRHRIRRGPLKFLVHNPDTSSRGTVSHVGSDVRH